MATASFDGQSLIVGGRRVWLVCGAVHYARTPRALWRSRLRAAKQAGLNCVDTSVFWNLHEPQPGRFMFDGDLDLRAFIQTIDQEGMSCILRPGPYMGSQWDFGGLPAWLHRIGGLPVRQANGPFLEACSRYLGAVLEQVKDLQVTCSDGGPILMMGVENRWFCDNPPQAQSYLLEMTRYLRENGCTVPMIDCNNLWSLIEGTIGGWSGAHHLAADLRQLRVVQPHAPRIVVEYEVGSADHWANEHNPDVDANLHLTRLAGMLAVGAQYSICPFHGGTNHGFFGGRSASAGYVTTSHDCDAPLAEAGGRGPKYLATKRISVFASQFSQLLAHLDPDQQHTAVAIENSRHSLAVFHQTGSQGQVTFLFKDSHDKTRVTELLLPNGLKLPVPIGDDAVAWILLEADLGGVAKLNYTNLRPWAFLGRRVLVLFGPASAEGLVCVNDALLRVKVPAGRTPLVEHHEEIVVVVLNGQQVDGAYLGTGSLIIGSDGIDDDDQPIPLKGWPRITTIDHDGSIQSLSIPPIKRAVAPSLSDWQTARVDSLIDGTSQSYRTITGPMSLEALGHDYGYGWYRIKAKSTKTTKAWAPESADRLHLYQGGRLTAILGDGPGADPNPVALKIARDTTVLADNLGRFSEGWLMGEQKGLFGHIYSVKAVALGKPQCVTERTPDLFALGGFFAYAHHTDRPICESLAWMVRRTGENPLIAQIDSLPRRVMLLVNDKPVGAYDPELCGGRARFLLGVEDAIPKTTNQIKLAFYGETDSHPVNHRDIAKHVRLYQVTANLTEKASWAFAPWTLPQEADFETLGKQDPSRPCWHRCTFYVSRVDVPLWLEPIGMTKGQLYVNGHNAGRYFMATSNGQGVGPQTRYYLQPWLRVNQPNELLLFDEHGSDPSRCRLVYDPLGPYGPRPSRRAATAAQARL